MVTINHSEKLHSGKYHVGGKGVVLSDCARKQCSSFTIIPSQYLIEPVLWYALLDLWEENRFRKSYG